MKYARNHASEVVYILLLDDRALNVRQLILAVGLVVAIAAIAGLSRRGAGTAPKVLSDAGVVVIAGAGRAKPDEPSTTSPPLLASATAPTASPEAMVNRRTTLTRAEQDDLSRMHSDLMAEARDEVWASSNELRLKSRLQNMGIFSNSTSRVICGAATCVLSTQTDPNPSPYNVERALEAMSRIGAGDAADQSLQTNRVYTTTGDRGETIFKVELMRNE